MVSTIYKQVLRGQSNRDSFSGRANHIDFCPRYNSKEDNKMKHKIKKQFILCFLTEAKVVTDASLASFGVSTETAETFKLEVAGIFISRFEALQELQSHEASDVEFTILEKLQVVKEDK